MEGAPLQLTSLIIITATDGTSGWRVLAVGGGSGYGAFVWHFASNGMPDAVSIFWLADFARTVNDCYRVIPGAQCQRNSNNDYVAPNFNSTYDER
jgi:hypothetical protein